MTRGFDRWLQKILREGNVGALKHWSKFGSLEELYFFTRLQKPVFVWKNGTAHALHDRYLKPFIVTTSGVLACYGTLHHRFQMDADATARQVRREIMLWLWIAKRFCVPRDIRQLLVNDHLLRSVQYNARYMYEPKNYAYKEFITVEIEVTRKRRRR